LDDHFTRADQGNFRDFEQKRGDSMSQIEALTQCLVLALTAPDDQKAQKASELAEQIAFGLSVDQVELCKNEALELVGFE
jgi:hypothetical protein